MKLPEKTFELGIKDELIDKEEFNALDYNVTIEFTEDKTKPQISIDTNLQTQTISFIIRKDKLFTLILLRQVIGGSLMNRLSGLYNRHLLKKAKEE